MTTVGLEIYRDWESLGVGCGSYDCYVISVLYCLENAFVSQLQTVLVSLALGASPRDSHRGRALPLGLRWTTSVLQTPCAHPTYKLQTLATPLGCDWPLLTVH